MAGQATDNAPLSPEMLAKVEQASAALDALGNDLTKLSRCGYDCRVEEAWRVALKDRFDRLLAEYGRGRRRG